MNLDPSRLDLSAAARQAVGKAYARPVDLAQRLETHRAGVLRLPPHPDWSGDMLDWAADPFSDRNWQFQHHTLRWLAPVLWAALDGDEQARAEWLATAQSWFEANVPASKAASSFAWKDMADGNRAINLSLGAALVGQEDAWFVELLEAHRDWLMDESHIVGKNHGLHQHAGLFVVGAVLRDGAAMDTAVKRMTAQFTTTFDEQGCNDEGSAAYHQMNLAWWSQAWDRVALEGRPIPEAVRASMAAAEDVLVHLAQPDGRIPQIGDSARGPLRPGHGPLAEFVASQGRRGTRPEGTVRVLDGGYVLSRSGWGESRPIADESHMVLRHGRDVRAHAHHDLGSVHLYSQGTPWLVDGGFHSYQPKDPTRKYLHSRAAHNVAVISGLEHDDSADVRLERAEVAGEAHDFVLADLGYSEVSLRRRVTYLVELDCWIVWDSADSPERRLVQQWHVEPGVTVQLRDRGFRLRSSRSALNMTWLGAAPRLRRHQAVEGDQRGWIGTRWKTSVPSNLLTAEAAAGPRGAAVLVAPAGREPLGVVDSYITSQGALTASLVRGGHVWALSIDEDVSVRES